MLSMKKDKYNKLKEGFVFYDFEQANEANDDSFKTKLKWQLEQHLSRRVPTSIVHPHALSKCVGSIWIVQKGSPEKHMGTAVIVAKPVKSAYIGILLTCAHNLFCEGFSSEVKYLFCAAEQDFGLRDLAWKQSPYMKHVFEVDILSKMVGRDVVFHYDTESGLTHGISDLVGTWCEAKYSCWH